MANEYIHKQLVIAVRKNDIDGVRRYLAAGANPNQDEYENSNSRDSLLHSTHDINVLKLLLKAGACINTRNRSRETPLRTSIEKYKSYEFVEELLKHGAFVDAEDRHGNTPLYLLMKRCWHGGPNLMHLELLLEYGADINTNNRDYEQTSLCIAMAYPSVAKLLIKYTLFNNFSGNYEKIVDLTRYKNHKHYGTFYEELTDYYKKCVAELERMQREMIVKNCSLYHLITEASLNLETYVNDVEKKWIRTCVSELLIGCNDTVKYPLYGVQWGTFQIMSTRIQRRLLKCRKNLVQMVEEIEIYTGELQDDNKEIVEKQRVVLDFYSKRKILEFISSKDILNLFVAFYKCTICIEREKMKKYMIAENCSLYDLLTVENMNFDILYDLNNAEKKCIRHEVLEILSKKILFSNYYFHQIIDKIQNRLFEERQCLLNTVDEMEISTKLVNDGNAIERKIVIDFYSKQELEKYLTNRDLLNLSVAFFECKNQCSSFVDIFCHIQYENSSNNNKRVR